MFIQILPSAHNCPICWCVSHSENKSVILYCFMRVTLWHIKSIQTVGMIYIREGYSKVESTKGKDYLNMCVPALCKVGCAKFASYSVKVPPSC